MCHDDNNKLLPEEDEHHCQVLAARIRQKIADYTYYQFTIRETRALNIFFDLAQEYQDVSYLYHLPVQILQFFFNVKAALYARDETGAFTIQTSEKSKGVVVPPLHDIAYGPLLSDSWWFFPAKGRPEPDTPEKGAIPSDKCEREILAILAILPETPFTEHEILFYEKFTNRLGFSLHNRLLALKNLEHIDFVRTLVHDIGHNVIVPNMHFKLMMRQMASKIADLRHLTEHFDVEDASTLEELNTLCGNIEHQYQEISTHFQQSSFFLETLLRQSHFDQGRYVLQRANVKLLGRILSPQVERYRQRLRDRDIVLEENYTEGTRDLCVHVDVGLISQVLANFLSNAVKYTRETPGRSGLMVRCSTIVRPDHFGPGKDGARVEILSTGPAIIKTEAEKLFSENFRASNTDGEEGTGHGLYFSRLILEQHGGVCGYHRADEGNVFFLTLPVFSPEETQPEGQN